MRRILERIDSPDDSYYLCLFNSNMNGGKEVWERKLGNSVGNGITVDDGYSNGWGSFNMVKATLNAMDFFRSTNYDYFLNLSGQCYPLTTVEGIKNRLSAEKGTGFIECNPLPWDRWVDENGGYDRIHRAWYKPFRSLNKISIPRLRKQLPGNMIPYGGSQWFCLAKGQVDYVLDLFHRDPELQRFYQRTLIPDEIFFQTILMNSPYRESLRMDDNLRYIDWKKKCVPLPAALLSEDLPRLINSGKLFARKFDLSLDERVLDLLDRHLDRLINS